MRFPGLFLGCGNDRLQPFSACHQIQIEPVDLLAYTSNMSSEALVNLILRMPESKVFYR